MFAAKAQKKMRLYTIFLSAAIVIATAFIALSLLSSKSTRSISKAIYPPSPVISDIIWDFKSHVQQAPGSDNWPITWADDDNLYTSWGDGGSLFRL